MSGTGSWRERLDELAALEDGWLDGTGRKVQPGALRAVRGVLEANYPQQSPPNLRMGMFATPEGGIELEWADTLVRITPEGRVESVIGKEQP